MKKKPSLSLLKKREESFTKKCWWLDKTNECHIHELSAAWEILRRTKTYRTLEKKMRKCRIRYSSSTFFQNQDDDRLTEIAHQWVAMTISGWNSNLTYLEIFDKIQIRNWFDLRFVFVEHLSELPTEGTKLVIIADISGLLHLRIFGVNGRIRFDKGEKDLPEFCDSINQLKLDHRDLSDQTEFSQSTTAKILKSVKKITGLNPCTREIDGWIGTPPNWDVEVCQPPIVSNPQSLVEIIPRQFTVEKLEPIVFAVFEVVYNGKEERIERYDGPSIIKDEHLTDLLPDKRTSFVWLALWFDIRLPEESLIRQIRELFHRKFYPDKPPPALWQQQLNSINADSAPQSKVGDCTTIRACPDSPGKCVILVPAECSIKVAVGRFLNQVRKQNIHAHLKEFKRVWSDRDFNEAKKYDNGRNPDDVLRMRAQQEIEDALKPRSDRFSYNPVKPKSILHAVAAFECGVTNTSMRTFLKRKFPESTHDGGYYGNDFNKSVSNAEKLINQIDGYFLPRI